MCLSIKLLLLLYLTFVCSFSSCGEFLGCMSFGIKHLMSRKKSGKESTEGKEGKEKWYYLLSENIGHRKHLESNTTATTATSQSDSDVMAKLDGMDDMSVVIARGYLGYGFTVKGSMPVRVGHVKETGAADDAGLRDGDAILRINAVDVTRATTEHVAAMIRTSEDQVIVDIRRKPVPIYESILTTDSAPATPSKENPIYENAGFHHTEEGTEVYVSWQPHLSVIKEESHVTGSPDTLTKSRRKSYSKWTPDISEISALSSRQSSRQQTSLSHLYSTTSTIRDFSLGSMINEETPRHGERFSSSEDDVSSVGASSMEDLTLRLSMPRSSSTPSEKTNTTGSTSTESWYSTRSSLGNSVSIL